MRVDAVHTLCYVTCAGALDVVISACVAIVAPSRTITCDQFVPNDAVIPRIVINTHDRTVFFAIKLPLLLLIFSGVVKRATATLFFVDSAFANLDFTPFDLLVAKLM